MHHVGNAVKLIFVYLYAKTEMLNTKLSGMGH